MDHKSSEGGHNKIGRGGKRVNHNHNMLYEKSCFLEKINRGQKKKEQTKINRKQN